MPCQAAVLVKRKAIPLEKSAPKVESPGTDLWHDNLGRMTSSRTFDGFGHLMRMVSAPAIGTLAGGRGRLALRAHQDRTAGPAEMANRKRRFRVRLNRRNLLLSSMIRSNHEADRKDRNHEKRSTLWVLPYDGWMRDQAVDTKLAEAK